LILSAGVSLGAWAAVPRLVLGWQPTVVTSGSMEPSIRRGDVVSVDPSAGAEITPGAVVVFRDPAAAGTVLHRVVRIEPDGRLRTKGDANRVADSTPVEPEALGGSGRLLVPLAGVPFLWAQEGAWVPIALLAGVAACVIWCARWSFVHASDEATESAPAEAARDQHEAKRLPRAAVIAIGVVAGGAAALLSLSPHVLALWVSSTVNTPSVMQAAGDFHTPIFDNASSTTGDRVSVLSWSHTVGAGLANRILVVGVTLDADHSVTGVTYAGTPLTSIGAQNDPDAATRVELWYLVAPQTGSNSVVVTLSGETNDDIVAGATSWRAVHQSTPLGTAVFASGESDTASVDVTSAAGEVVVDVVASDRETVSADGGQTEHWSAQPNKLGGGGSSELGAASVTMSWTLGQSTFWAIGGVPLKPVSP
jgi:signal peptidase I